MTTERIVEAIEELVVESVGITTVALVQAMPGFELSLSQWRALVVVGSIEGGMRVGEVAGRIGSAVPTTSRLVRRLERRGLIEAVRDEADRRATIVRLTEAGEGLRARLVERRRQLIREALNGSALPNDLSTGLEGIVQALRRYA